MDSEEEADQSKRSPDKADSSGFDGKKMDSEEEADRRKRSPDKADPSGFVGKKPSFLPKQEKMPSPISLDYLK